MGRGLVTMGRGFEVLLYCSSNCSSGTGLSLSPPAPCSERRGCPPTSAACFWAGRCPVPEPPWRDVNPVTCLGGGRESLWGRGDERQQKHADADARQQQQRAAAIKLVSALRDSSTARHGVAYDVEHPADSQARPKTRIGCCFCCRPSIVHLADLEVERGRGQAPALPERPMGPR